LLDIGPDITPRVALGDKGYSSKAIAPPPERAALPPVIPHKTNEKNRPAFFAETLYTARAYRTRLRTTQAIQTRRVAM
jgi:hypothetical protein